jgi:hypothetical protein
MHWVSSHTFRQAGHLPPVEKVSQRCPQLHRQYGFPSGSQPHLGHLISMESIMKLFWRVFPGKIHKFYDDPVDGQVFLG